VASNKVFLSREGEDVCRESIVFSSLSHERISHKNRSRGDFKRKQALNTQRGCLKHEYFICYYLQRNADDVSFHADCINFSIDRNLIKFHLRSKLSFLFVFQ
jgi:hypothetical protein